MYTVTPPHPRHTTSAAGKGSRGAALATRLWATRLRATRLRATRLRAMRLRATSGR